MKTLAIGKKWGGGGISGSSTLLSIFFLCGVQFFLSRDDHEWNVVQWHLIRFCHLSCSRVGQRYAIY